MNKLSNDIKKPLTSPRKLTKLLVESDPYLTLSTTQWYISLGRQFSVSLIRARLWSHNFCYLPDQKVLRIWLSQVIHIIPVLCMADHSTSFMATACLTITGHVTIIGHIRVWTQLWPVWVFMQNIGKQNIL